MRVGMRLWTPRFFMMILINLFIFLSFQMLIPVLPLYAESLGAGPGKIGLITAVLTLASLTMRPFAGKALDQYGRRPVVLTGLAFIVGFTFLYGLITSFWILLATRFLHGFAWGAASTGTNTAAADNIPRPRFGEGMGYFALSTALAIALGPALGLYLMEHFHFQVTSLVATLLAAIALGLAALTPMKKGSGKPTEKQGIYEKAAIRPALMIFLITASMGAITNFIALYGKALGITSVSLFFVVYALFVIVSRPISGKISDRYGYRPVVLPAFVSMIGAMACLSQAQTLTHFLIAGALFGGGFAAAQTVFQAMSVVLSPKNRTGAANATFFTGFDGGIGFGALVSGLIAQQVGYAGMFGVFTGFLLLSLLLYVLLGWKITHPYQKKEM